MISGQDYEEQQFGLNPLESYTEYKWDTRCELLFLWPILTIIMLMLFVASFFFAINASMMWKKLMWKNWQVQGRSNRRNNEYGDVLYCMGPRNKIDQEVVKEVNQNADPEVDLKGNLYIDALQKKIPQSKAITTDEQLLIDTENLNNLMRCLNIADNSVSDDSNTNNLINEVLPIDNDIYAKKDDVSNIQEEDITYLSAEREDQNKDNSISIQPNLIIINNIFSNTDNTKALKITDGLMNYKDINKLVAQQIKSCAKSLTENKNTLQVNELFVNKSLIQNSESDPEIVMKISNQSHYGQSVFRPAKDWSSGDAQENNARKIIKSSQSDGTFDIDLAINDNLSSTSSQIFRASRYNDSSNDSKSSLSGNCLIDSDIFKIPENTSEKSVDFIDIADEDFHPNIPEKREAENGPDEIVEVVLYDPDGNPVIVNFRVLSDV
ncbi:uncharacterized protein LOC132792656 [Drosophila nasuta]|uniref:uncharacterized protein LOC132792656 n=1 Tax=Drosophila nasuta TaxID=42062 RepID=UPI00295EAB9F|nr:uncharacterized protein LOC132792656 [Drosophila nasuta]